MRMQDLIGRLALGIAFLLAARGIAIGGEPAGSLRTILGTSTWDVDADQFVRGGAADFFWRHMDATKRSLTPTGGAKAAVLRDAKFADVSAEEAGKLRLTAEPLDASDKGSTLLPGTVVVFRTNKGRLGILEIVRYRALHDFSFPEAKQIPAGAREMIRKSPNMPKYHLVVRWRFLGK